MNCVALKGFQIAAGTKDGSVYILECDMKNRKIEVLNKLGCPCSSPIDQIRFLRDEGDATTRCMFFQPNKVSMFEWKLDTIKTFKEMLPEAIDVPGEVFYHLDAIQTAEDPSKYLLFGTGKERTAISVRHVDHDGFLKQEELIWDSAEWRFEHKMPKIEETEILDISSDGWLLLAEDTCEADTRGVRLIDVYSTSTYLAAGFLSGCLLSTTRTEASFVVQGIMPSALRAYNWNADKQERTLLQTWGSEAPGTKDETIQKWTAGCNGNFVII